MSERRPHWSDDLIDAVIDLQYHCLDCIEYDYLDIDPRNHDALNAAWAYDIIAAVEDWHKAKRASRDRTHSDECWRWHQECAEALIEAQQARLGKLSKQLMWYPDYQAAEAAIRRVRDVLDEWDDLVIDGEDPEEHIIRALDDNKGVNND